MDKVIIDGIDVSECSYCLNNQLKGKGHAPAKSMPYAKETSCIACKEDITRLNFCKNNPNCYYKQLKRTEQEYERLKSENENLKIYIESNKQQIEEVETLVMENAELKSDIESRTMCITCERELQNCNLQAENERLIAENKELSESIKRLKNMAKAAALGREKYRQALQEIRDMVDCANCEYESNDNCNPQQCSKIETKINEVIGANQ